MLTKVNNTSNKGFHRKLFDDCGSSVKHWAHRRVVVKEQWTTRKSSESWEGIRAGKVSHLVCGHTMSCLPLLHSGISHAQIWLHATMFSVLHKSLSKKVTQDKTVNPTNLPQTHWHSRVIVILHLTNCVLCLLSISTIKLWVFRLKH